MKNDLNYYKKRFPINSEFYYKTKYGGFLKMKVHSIESYSNLNYKFYIQVRRNGTYDGKTEVFGSYDISKCVPFNRKKKLNRILKNN